MVILQKSCKEYKIISKPIWLWIRKNDLFIWRQASGACRTPWKNGRKLNSTKPWKKAKRQQAD